MRVYEKINLLLRERKLLKKDFVKMLLDLEPLLQSTGNTPSEKTVYKYLNGTVNIPIELVPYIAEALDIPEQNLFDDSMKMKLKFCEEIVKNADAEEINYINKLITTKLLENSHNLEKKLDLHDTQIQKLLHLLPFAPKSMVDHFIVQLKKIKETVLSMQQ